MGNVSKIIVTVITKKQVNYRGNQVDKYTLAKTREYGLCQGVWGLLFSMGTIATDA